MGDFILYRLGSDFTILARYDYKGCFPNNYRSAKHVTCMALVFTAFHKYHGFHFTSIMKQIADSFLWGHRGGAHATTQSYILQTTKLQTVPKRIITKHTLYKHNTYSSTCRPLFGGRICEKTRSFLFVTVVFSSHLQVAFKTYPLVIFV